jgi:hypothetical protein
LRQSTDVRHRVSLAIRLVGHDGGGPGETTRPQYYR